MFQTSRVCSGMDWLCPQVPAVPVLPLVSIFMNVYLMTKINIWTWTQFGISNAIGKWFSGIKTTIEWLNLTLFLLCLPQTLSEAIIGGLLGISKWGECLLSLLIISFLYWDLSYTLDMGSDTAQGRTVINSHQLPSPRLLMTISLVLIHNSQDLEAT